MKTRTKQKRLTAEMRREVILSAATEVFSECGYEGTSTNEIARRAGVTVPIIYDHFASKLELWEQVLTAQFDRLRESWTQPLETPKQTRTEGVRRALEGWTKFIDDHRSASKLLFRAASSTPEAESIRRRIARQSWSIVMRRLPEILGLPKGTKSEEMRAVMIGEILRAGLQGLTAWWHENETVPREKIIEAAMTVLWHGLERTRQKRA